MVARDVQVDSIDEVIVKQHIKLNLRRQSKHMDLKLIEDIYFVGRPVDRHLVGSGYFHVIDTENALDLGALRGLLPSQCVWFQLDLVGLLVEVVEDIHVVWALEDLQLVEGVDGTCRLSLFANLQPEIVDCL